MLMTDISLYLELNGRASLLDLARHFRVAESAMQQMLSFWVKKGKITLVDASQTNCATGHKCSDCFECSDSAHQVYVWNNTA
ncbi:FeoC-like transcriptional regulator [Orbus sturtevantii]|uniref:FeoC-like transcriptional regulator n=1 Tax=Orbus sturtevantii TaxID=3074109 RepID=UPI00370D3BFB